MMEIEVTIKMMQDLHHPAQSRYFVYNTQLLQLYNQATNLV